MLERVTAPRAVAMATVVLELVAAELVHRLPPFSHALCRVTLDLASGITETRLLPPSSQNSLSTAVLRAPPHGCQRNMVSSLPRGMPKVVDYRQTGAQATNEMMTQDRHEVLSRFGHREGVIPTSCV